MLLLTLRGTPTLYYGDELGMVDVEVPPERVVDPDGRDPERSPMPWTSAPGRGFCPDGVEPWLPFGDPALSVEAQEGDPRSMLALHRRLLALRRERDDLAAGAYETVAAGDAVLAYRRGERTLVALNLGDEPVTAEVAGEIVLTTELDAREGERADGALALRPGEGAVLREDPSALP
jgi:alpha-glucosidase